MYRSVIINKYFHCTLNIIEACSDGDVRLSGSTQNYAGRVELCVERTWTTLCDQTWDFNDAAVICRQLGYSSYGNACMGMHV